MNCKPAEAHRDVFVALEAPEQQARVADIVGRQSRLDQCGPEPIALPRRQRQGKQAADHDGDLFAHEEGQRRERAPSRARRAPHEMPVP